MKKHIAVIAICGIVLLESLNMVVLKKNGTLLNASIAAISGIAGWCLKRGKPDA